ncbi:hypothetical protein M3193_08000 [Sporosarcina luteola]|uniref:hypothetical protein n=1 Tax=Sporosarcina luteola TaxID=582850 RepID=UPI00203EB026|nr:hypothetical protein [Sporosarcina luteola]MCM3744084.1 hypothetical protein [Sporosarcina luteola]
MNAANDIAFLEEVKKYTQHEFKALVDNVFNSLSKKYNKRVSFGRNGGKEFGVALLLSEFDGSTLPYIDHGVDQVFIGNWGPVEFSNFMDKVILDNSVISYPAWSKAYRLIEKNHAWLTEHPCSVLNMNSTDIAKSIFINS